MEATIGPGTFNRLGLGTRSETPTRCRADISAADSSSYTSTTWLPGNRARSSASAGRLPCTAAPASYTTRFGARSAHSWTRSSPAETWPTTAKSGWAPNQPARASRNSRRLDRIATRIRRLSPFASICTGPPQGCR